MTKYHKAQICLNGHVISAYNSDEADFCEHCGSKTISKCPNCNSFIRGKADIPGLADLTKFIPPDYCPDCGEPYPWTQSKLDAIEELIEFDENLSNNEKDYINDNIQSLIIDTPKTKAVATKFNYYLRKAGSATVSAIRDILVDIASETAKKIIFPE